MSHSLNNAPLIQRTPNTDMERGSTGRYDVTSVGGEDVRAFVPDALPPQLELTGDRQRLLEKATLALGRLDSITTLLPDPQLFLYAYIRREAVLSSQIEGTQSSLSDLLLFELEEAPGVPFDDVVEVSNYVAALEHGMARLRGGFPLSNRLIREMHEKLLARGRGSEKQPGEFRRSQNWIGGTRPGNAHFVPPPPALVEEAMSALERMFHDADAPYPVLVTAALAHVQFETIHPFLDGNGRIGRLLIPILLHHAGMLQQPLLYLSLYFKQHRDEVLPATGSRTDGRRLGSMARLLSPRRRHDGNQCRRDRTTPCQVVQGRRFASAGDRTSGGHRAASPADIT